MGGVLFGDGDRAAVDVQKVSALFEGGHMEVPVHEHVALFQAGVFVVSVRQDKRPFAHGQKGKRSRDRKFQHLSLIHISWARRAPSSGWA